MSWFSKCFQFEDNLRVTLTRRLPIWFAITLILTSSYAEITIVAYERRLVDDRYGATKDWLPVVDIVGPMSKGLDAKWFKVGQYIYLSVLLSLRWLRYQEPRRVEYYNMFVIYRWIFNIAALPNGRRYIGLPLYRRKEDEECLMFLLCVYILIGILCRESSGRSWKVLYIILLYSVVSHLSITMTAAIKMINKKGETNTLYGNVVITYVRNRGELA